jgi:hypothetical protein
LVGRHRSDGSTDHRIRANNVTTRADASATYKSRASVSLTDSTTESGVAEGILDVQGYEAVT